MQQECPQNLATDRGCQSIKKGRGGVRFIRKIQKYTDPSVKCRGTARAATGTE